MSGSSLQQKLEHVIRLQAAGKLSEAESLCAQITAQQPNHSGLLHLHGLLNYQLGRHERAIALIARAIELQPDNPELHSNHGVVLLAAGRALEAVAACNRAVQLRPDYPEALNNLGNAARAAGQIDESLSAYRAALALRPVFAEAHNNLGNVLKDQRDLPAALAAYRQALAVNPNYAEAHYNLATALRATGELVEAIDHFRTALELRPGYTEALSALWATERDHGLALEEAGRIDDAIAHFRAALALRPDETQNILPLAKLLAEIGHFDEAIALQRRAVALRPDDAELHLHLAVTLLAAGQFSEGWREYEWRLRAGAPSPATHLPTWTGEPLSPGQRILVEAEQGIGDAIQFVRYLPLLARRGAQVLLRCDRSLVRLFQSVSGIAQIIPDDDPPPAADFRCALLSLPLAFGTTAQTIPADVPYLHPDPQIVERFGARLSARNQSQYPQFSPTPGLSYAEDPGLRSSSNPASNQSIASEPASNNKNLKVALVWAGRPRHRNDRQRSLPPHLLATLQSVPGVEWFSLQKGERASEIPATGLPLIDWTDDLTDFADTAGLLANLDLLITVDTAVAHLAGALAKPVWLLLSTATDFRWMATRPDTPWYPTMRLFRQHTRGDWPSAIEQIRAELLSMRSTPHRDPAL